MFTFIIFVSCFDKLPYNVGFLSEEECNMKSEERRMKCMSDFETNERGRENFQMDLSEIYHRKCKCFVQFGKDLMNK